MRNGSLPPGRLIGFVNADVKPKRPSAAASSFPGLVVANMVTVSLDNGILDEDGFFFGS